MQQKSKKKGRSLKTLVISDVLIIICIGMLCYPIVTDIWNSAHSSYMHSEYSDIVSSLETQDYSEILRKAQEYNETLVGRGNTRFSMSDKERSIYNESLVIPGTDVMAYLDAPTIGVRDVPIYHGTSNAVLQAGAGHMEGSSLPIGGPSTHSVISGHTGMAGMKMFTDLRNIKDGDLFQITVLGDILTYEVDDRHEVYPNEIKYLDIEEGRDYCTLITCVPIGVNSQRLLVRGHRVPTPTKEELKELIREKEQNPFVRLWNYLNNRFADYELIMTGLAIVLFFGFILPDILYYKKRSRKNRNNIDSADDKSV